MEEKVPGVTEEQRRALAEGMNALAKTTRGMSAPPSVEAAVLARMRGSVARPLEAQRPATRMSGFGLAAAAALLVISISGAWLAYQVGTPAGPIQPKGFIALPGAAALPPIESGSIVRLVVPVSALPEYGLAITPDLAGGGVDVELLIAQDGVARAIRLADNSNSSRSTP